jgi:hypothetical protein
VHGDTTRYRILLPLVLCLLLTGCVHRTVRTTVHQGARVVVVGFDVREADGRAVPVAVEVLAQRGTVMASNETTPWHGPAFNVVDGTLVQLDAARVARQRHAGVLRCHVETFDSAFVMQMLVTSRDSCQVRGVITSTDAYIDAYGPRS